MSKHSRRHRAARPFMPLHGGKAVPHRAAGNRHSEERERGEDVRENQKPDTVMQVGADAMIDDSNARAEPEARDENVDNEEARENEETREEEQESVGMDRRHINLAEAFSLPKEDLPVPDEEQPKPAAAGGSELDDVRAERDSYLDMARRERADFDNYRKRMEREMGQMKRKSLADFLKEFFGPLDDLDRVLQESAKNHSFESLVTGVRIMEENFWRTLAKAGVKRIDAKGKPFDPNLHEAMTTMPSADVPPNTVLEVFENGYKLDDFILRPARVVVSRAAEPQ